MPTFPAPSFAEAEFRKSSFSQPNGDCVQVARRAGWVALRDDKTAFGAENDHRLLLHASDFDSTVAAWRTGDDGAVIEIIHQPDDGHVMQLTGGAGPGLVFSSAEIDAFLCGVISGEFNGGT